MTKRKSRYTGVKRLPDGRYRIRARTKCRKTGRMKEADRIIEAASAKEAAERRVALIAELRGDRARRKPKRVKLKTYARSWLRMKLPSLKSSTRRIYADILDLHLLPALGEYYVDAIEPEDLAEWRDSMVAAPDSINGRLRVAKQVIRAAVVRHSLPRDPTIGVEFVRKPYEEGDDDEDNRRLTADELGRLLDYVSEHYTQWFPLVVMLAFTGMRFGEASAVKWMDIDFETGVLRVRRAHWHGVVDHPKTKVSRRDTVLDTRLVEVLQEHRQTQLRNQARGLETGFVFLSRVGGLHQPSCLAKPLKATCKALGIDKKVSAQTFRRTFNHLAEQVAAGRVVRSLVGHGTEDMTAHYSGRATLDEKREAIASIGNLVLLRGGHS